MSQEMQLYLPTTLTTKVNLRARDINPYLNQNIQQAIEKKFGNKFFNFGHVRPGTIKVIEKSIGNKLGSSDFLGNIYYKVRFQCEVYLPQIEQQIEARVKSINKIGILAKSDNNKLTILLSKPHQSNLELFSQVMLETRIRIKILDFKIDNQNDTIVVFGDLTQILEGIYQNYQLPKVEGMRSDIRGDLEVTPDIRLIYSNYGNFIESVNSKSLMDPYSMFKPSKMDPREWLKIRQSKKWQSYKNHWSVAKSAVEDYELVYPTGNYNRGNGVAIMPFKARAISRAYFKMWELLHRYPDIIARLPNSEKITILALAEGPGGFIQAISHYRSQQGAGGDVCYGCTLEADPKKYPNLRWDWAKSKDELKKTGAILNLTYGNLTQVATLKKILADLDGKKVDLIVADGAIENINVYNYEEIVNYRLFFGEIAGALLTQNIGGNFVIKIFDILTNVTRQFLLLLNHYYSEVFITKPDFSRPASSEKYVVCLGFKGTSTPNQTEEDVQATIFELMEMWNSKVVEDLEIYYPNNEMFLLRLLNYQLSDEADFAQKIQEISQDHIKKQSEHIMKGIHLIHTKALNDQQLMESIKNAQVKKAIQWCQKYKLQYKEDVKFAEEKIVNSDIVNTSQTLQFSLSTLKKDEKDTFNYLQQQYPYFSLEYLQERVIALKFRLEMIASDYLSQEIYQFKTGFLDPVGYLNDQLGEKKTSAWYSLYEILLQQKIADGKKNYSVLVNSDSAQTSATQAIYDYMTKKIGLDKKNLTLKSCIDYKKYSVQGSLADPTGWIEDHIDMFLMGESNDNNLTNGNLADPTTLKWFQTKYATAKDKVDLYIGDLRIPKVNQLIEGFMLDPERSTIREMIGQTVVGLMSLKNQGEMICRQYTPFEPLSVSMYALLQQVFEEVLIIKPLVSRADSEEIYLVGRNFQAKKMTPDLIKYVLDIHAEIPGLEELEDGETILPAFDQNLLGGEKKIIDLKEKLVYIAHRIYILNFVPKIQINLDLFENARYQISSQQNSSLNHLLVDKQELLQDNPSELSPEEIASLTKIDEQIDQIFSEVARKIISEDFKYLIEETVTNWLDLYGAK